MPHLQPDVPDQEDVNEAHGDTLGRPTVQLPAVHRHLQEEGQAEVPYGPRPHDQARRRPRLSPRPRQDGPRPHFL